MKSNFPQQNWTKFWKSLSFCEFFCGAKAGKWVSRGQSFGVGCVRCLSEEFPWIRNILGEEYTIPAGLINATGRGDNAAAGAERYTITSRVDSAAGAAVVITLHMASCCSWSVLRQTATDAGELGIKSDVRDVALPKVGLSRFFMKNNDMICWQDDII